MNFYKIFPLKAVETARALLYYIISVRWILYLVFGRAAVPALYVLKSERDKNDTDGF